MKKLVIGLVSACTLLGSASVMANESACNQLGSQLERGQYPQKLDKHTVQRAYEVSYKSKTDKCEVVANYDFHIQKFVDQVVEMAPILERNPGPVARAYVTSDRGERALRQMIAEEYEPKYQALKDQGVVVKMNARFTGVKDEEVEPQYYELFK